MIGYDVVSSVRLRRPTPRLTEWPLPVLFMDEQDPSIVYLGYFQ